MRSLLPLLVSLALLSACTDKDGSETGTSGGVDADGDGYVEADDCDDEDSAVHPDADETCNGIDDDCDGETDEDPTDPSIFYTDADGDGYGDPESPVEACEQPSDAVTDNTDCNDAVAKSNPAATEICDGAGVDEDCDGLVNEDDDSLDTSTAYEWYADKDHDYYGDASGEGVVACAAPSGYTGNNRDCNDDDASINPIAKEVCDDDDVDENCTGTADDADDEVDTSTQTETWVDADGDGYGDETATSVLYCDPPSGVVTDNTDCDDSDASVYPDESGVCTSGDGGGKGSSDSDF